MNILVIDPWGINNTREYLYGLVSGLSRHENVTLMSNYYYSHPNNEKYKFIKTFFKISEDMKDSIFRKVIRGIEYIIGYIKILIFLRKNDIDIVHINWLLFYKLDNIFLKLIKRKNINIIYTAHNAVPHINSCFTLFPCTIILSTLSYILSKSFK